MKKNNEKNIIAEFDKIFDEFYQWCINKINGEHLEKPKLATEQLTRTLLLNIEKLFSFLLKHENNDYYKNQEQTQKCFEEGLFYKGLSYHIDTNDYNDLIKKPELKKLEENQIYDTKNITEAEETMILESDVYLKTKSTIVNYAKLTQQPFAKKYLPLGEVPMDAYLRLRKSMPRKYISSKGVISIPKDKVEKIIPDLESQDILLQPWKNRVLIVSPKKKNVDNFFGNKFYKIYNSNGEVDKNIIPYGTIIRKIRHSVAHKNITEALLETGQHVVLFKIDKDPNNNISENFTIIFDHLWFFYLCNMKNMENSDEFKYIYFPRTTKKIESEKEFNEILSNARLFEIKFKESAQTDRIAFMNYTDHLAQCFKRDENIKLSIDEYLTKHLLKYYTDVQVSPRNLQIIPNLWMRFKNKIVHKKIENLKNKKEILEFQDKFFGLNLNNHFIDKINQNNEDFKQLSNETVTNIATEYVLDFINPSKHNDYRIGFEIEDLVTLSQLRIFQKLINNNLYEKIKIIKKHDMVDIKYLNSEAGKLRTAINSLDMSKFEILQTKQPLRKVETLGDKIFSLRLLRNSISHNGFSYELSNTKEIFDTYLKLSSYEHPKISLRVRIKDLLELLNQDFFKSTKYTDIIRKPLSIQEITEEAKKLCLTDNEDESEQ